MAPKLTAEEKKALKAAKKEEKKRQKIEQAKQIQRDYLGREVKYGELTLKRHEKEWRKMLMNLALPKMREDLEFAWHNFERVIDCKNFTISLLMDEIRESEEQYMMNVKNHIEHIDKLMELFRGQVEEVRDDYEHEIMRLQQENAEYIEQLKLSAEEEDIYMKTMSYMLALSKKQQKQNVGAEYFSKLEEQDHKYNKTINTIRIILEHKFQCMLSDTIYFINHYEHQTKERIKEHNTLKNQDNSLQELLVDQLEKIRKVCEYIKVLKTKLSDSKKLLGRKLSDVENENEFFANTFSMLKSRLEIDRKKDIQQIIYQTVNYNKTIEYLEKLRDKVESVLHMSAVCRKLETQKEKVMPFPTPTVEHLPGTMKMAQHVSPLNLFWQRVAQADASRYAINEEREVLRNENVILKKKIYTYCQCVSCPIPIKNVLKTSVRHITEGVFEQKKYQKQNVSQFISGSCHFDIDE